MQSRTDSLKNALKDERLQWHLRAGFRVIGYMSLFTGVVCIWSGHLGFGFLGVMAGLSLLDSGTKRTK